MHRKAPRDAGDNGCLPFVLLFPCCFPFFIWKVRYTAAHLAIALIVWITLAAVLSAITFRFVLHNSETWRVFPREERILSSARYTDVLFCSGVRLEPSHHTRILAYSSSQRPQLEPRKRVISFLKRRFKLDSADFVRFSAFLPPHSTLTAAICSQGKTVMYLVRGDDNLACVLYGLYNRETLDYNCVQVIKRYDANVTYPQCTAEPWPGLRGRVTTDNEEAQFHVIYAAQQNARIEAVVVMNRSSYETPVGERNLQFCNGTGDCSLHFFSDQWSGSRTIVDIRIGSEDRSRQSVTAECIPNVTTYVLLFVGVPALAYIVVAIIYICLHRYQKRKQEAINEEPELLGSFYTHGTETLPSRIDTFQSSSELQPIIRR